MCLAGQNEQLLTEVLNAAWPGQWEKEHKGIMGRKFRFDCANPKLKIAIEIEGGIWLGAKGGHTNGLGYTQNMEKYNLAMIEGWRVLRYEPSTLKKSPWKIIRDIRRLCGTSTNEKGQAELNFDHVEYKPEHTQLSIGYGDKKTEKKIAYMESKKDETPKEQTRLEIT